MNNDTSQSNNSSSVSFINRTIFGLNRIGIQHFEAGRFPEASECFLSAIQTLKRHCWSSLGGEQQQQEEEDLSSNDDHRTLDLSIACSSCLDSVYETTATTPLCGAVLKPMDFCDLYFLSQQQLINEFSIPLRDVSSRCSLIGFVLIFNLACTTHRFALVVDEPQQQQANLHTSNATSRVSGDILVNRALRLYQTIYEGVSQHDYNTIPFSHGFEDETIHSRQVVLGQQLLLSTIHNMGLLLLSTEGKQPRNVLTDETVMNSSNSPTTTTTTHNNNNNNNSIRSNNTRESQYQLSSSWCFQVVFATLHRLSDYYGIQHSDFPPDFDLQLVIDTALEQLLPMGGTDDDRPLVVYGGTAPCA